MAKKQIRTYFFSPGGSGLGTIIVPGKVDLDQLLLITNVTRNVILYNFADPATAVTTLFDPDNESTYLPKILMRDVGYTTITLSVNTSTYQDTDELQIYVEAKNQEVSLKSIHTDAMERLKVGLPQAMLDADFEYGLQPTKWQALGLSRNYPSVYEIPGTDAPVSSVSTDASTGNTPSGTGQSLLTITTTNAHSFVAGEPITVKGLANTVTGFSRAEGSFIINSVPSSTTLTYYAKSKVGTSNGQVLSSSYTQLRKGGFFTGSGIGSPTITVQSNGSSGNLTTSLITASGSDLVGFTGSAPPVGAPLSGAGIAVGTQITGVNGSGGTVVTATMDVTANIGDTVLPLLDDTGISVGLAVNRGDGVAVYVTQIASGDVTLSGPLTSAKTSGSSVAFISTVSFSQPTTAQIASGQTRAYTAIATLEATFTSAHGLVPGCPILVDITSTGSNHTLAEGPYFVESVPTLTTLRYTAKSAGTISTSEDIVGTIYARPDSFFVHRPYDGGVQLGTGGPNHGGAAIRQSKKYIRYQSGKGVMYNTGALFAPSYDIQSVSASGTAIGSYITIVTDDVDHGCQTGAVIVISGVVTAGYNGQYTVADIVDERTLRVQATQLLDNTTATLSSVCLMSLKNWHGATVRAGVFDDQNGMFWQYDGQYLAVGLRSSTFQIAGTISVNANSNAVTGTSSRFTSQLKAGDKIVLKGMTHVVSSVSSDTAMTITPDFRGASNVTNAKIVKTIDTITKQSDFNIDPIDGTGESGYNADISKMQMIGLQYTWYGAGFIDFMLRGGDGNYIFVHRMKHSNVNTEAYMRTGNLPVRYEVINESAISKLMSTINSSASSIVVEDGTYFPNQGTLYVDNEIINYTGKTANTLTGCSRAATLTNFSAGSQRNYTAGTAASHIAGAGVILISNTVSPIISHWGSAYLTDGRFDEDRGYLFNYVQTGLTISGTKQTAFLIRLAPSVSNAIIGDLGDRELLNRAQLLLKGIEISTDSVSGDGAIVIEGILNPSNYPTNPTNISWNGLSNQAQGGQPSFSQIAAGGSVTWSGASNTTATATVQGALTGTFTMAVPGFLAGDGRTYSNAVEGGRNRFFLSNADAATSGITVGDTVTSQFPTGTTVNEIITSYAGSTYTRYNVSQNAASTVATGSIALRASNTAASYTNTNFLFFTSASWTSSGATVGTRLDSSVTSFPSNTAVNSVTTRSLGGTSVVRATFSQTSNTTISAAGTLTFAFGATPSALPGEQVFSFITRPGENAALDLSELKELTTTSLGGRGTYPNGPDVLAINVYKVSGTSTTANIILRWGEAQA